MNRIICDIHNALQNSRKTIEFLTQNSSYTWVGDHPIAIVNEKIRIEDERSLSSLEAVDFFDAQGFSKNSFSQKEINYLRENVPSAIKTTYCLCMKKKETHPYNFKEKFEHDRWKKIQDNAFNFEVFLEFSKFRDTHSSVDMETELRDIMRSSKEIAALKCIGFVWIVTLPKSSQIENILEHYFGENHIFIEHGHKITYIAWDKMLANINMRHFVNTP